MTVKKISWAMQSYAGQPPNTVVAKTRVTVTRVDNATPPAFQDLATSVTSLDVDFAIDVAYVIKVEALDPNGIPVPGVGKSLNYTLASISVQGPGGVNVG